MIHTTIKQNKTMKTNIFSLLLCTVLLLSCGNKPNKNTA